MLTERVRYRRRVAAVQADVSPLYCTAQPLEAMCNTPSVLLWLRNRTRTVSQRILLRKRRRAECCTERAPRQCHSTTVELHSPSKCWNLGGFLWLESSRELRTLSCCWNSVQLNTRYLFRVGIDVERRNIILNTLNAFGFITVLWKRRVSVTCGVQSLARLRRGIF